MRWKLVFVAAAALMLALAAPSRSVVALAQPSRVASSNLATATPAASIFTRRATQPRDVAQERRLAPGPIIGLICAIAASSLALGIAFGLRRRIDRIAGPDPDKDDD